MDQILNQNLDVLSVYECERIVENLREIPLKSYGSQKWLTQHNIFSKLNLQAHVNATTRSDEFVMESLVTFDKVKIILKEIISCNLWVKEVLPQIKPEVLKSGIRSYLSIFHQGLLVNLLEIISYNKSALASLDS